MTRMVQHEFDRSLCMYVSRKRRFLLTCVNSGKCEGELSRPKQWETANGLGKVRHVRIFFGRLHRRPKKIRCTYNEVLVDVEHISVLLFLHCILTLKRN